MTRRTFLKGMAQASLVALASLPLSLLPVGTHPMSLWRPDQSRAASPLRGTRDGLISAIGVRQHKLAEDRQLRLALLDSGHCAAPGASIRHSRGFKVQFLPSLAGHAHLVDGGRDSADSLTGSTATHGGFYFASSADAHDDRSCSNCMPALVLLRWSWSTERGGKGRVRTDCSFNAQRQPTAFQFPGRSGRLLMPARRGSGGLLSIAVRRDTADGHHALPERRNAGVGTALIRDLQQEAAQAGKPLRLHVETFNPALAPLQPPGIREDRRVLGSTMRWSGVSLLTRARSAAGQGDMMACPSAGRF